MRMQSMQVVQESRDGWKGGDAPDFFEGRQPLLTAVQVSALLLDLGVQVGLVRGDIGDLLLVLLYLSLDEHAGLAHARLHVSNLEVLGEDLLPHLL